MKKHQLVAMALSALSAGVLISCSKSTETNQDSAAVDASAEETASIDNDKTANDKTASNSSNNTNVNTSEAANIEAIDLKPEVEQTYLVHVAEDQIVPTYQTVAKQSYQLNNLANKFCQSGSANNEQLQQLRKQWLALAQAWAAAEIVNFGPAMDSMSNLYINYYPDQRGLVHQGVIDLIDANPDLTPDQLASESAIVQGIPGIEEVLYANDSLSAGQCRYIISASQALTDRLNSVQIQWDESAPELLGVNQDANSEIKNIGMNRWINALLSLVETTKSRSLDQPLGLTGGKKGHLPAAAAGQSRAIITAKVAALSQALTDAQLVAILAQNNKDTLADDMSTVLADTSALLAQLPEDISKASTRQQKELYDKLTTLTQLIKHQLMPTLGVQVGFNSTDGD